MVKRHNLSYNLDTMKGYVMTNKAELLMLNKPKLNEAFYWKGYADALNGVQADTTHWETMWRVNYESGLEDAILDEWSEA